MGQRFCRIYSRGTGNSRKRNFNYTRTPVAESNHDNIGGPIEEQGHDPINLNLMLYSLPTPLCENGRYSLRMMTDKHKDEIISAIAHLPNYQPIGFVNKPDKDDCEPMNHMWSIKMKDKVNVAVQISDINLNPKQCEIKFLPKGDVTRVRRERQREVKRETIDSKPYSRLISPAGDCAKVDFTIDANCETSKGARFRVVVQSDMETKSKDYNLLFIRDPPEDCAVLPVTGRRH